MKKKNQIGIVVLVLALTLTACTGISQKDTLDQWTAGSPAKEELVKYVQDVTHEKSANFIPVEDRIAVFDMDGTLMCERDPIYFEWMMLLQRILNDPTYEASEAEQQFALDVQQAIAQGGSIDPLEAMKSLTHSTVFAGMTIEECEAYVLAFMQTPSEKFENMTRGEAFYQPMLQMVLYLQNNGFTVYVVTGADRMVARALTKDVLHISPHQVIGTDFSIVASGQGSEDGETYTFTPNDVLLRGNQEMIKNLKMNKVSAIMREIGKQPVLAFGNSSGDASMLEYASKNNPYESRAFLVINDDLQREYGSDEKSAKYQEMADQAGWVKISMKNDFKTIYGEDVVLKAEVEAQAAAA